jgi:hypothetical protein
MIKALNKKEAKEVNLKAPRVLASDMGNTNRKLKRTAHTV